MPPKGAVTKKAPAKAATAAKKPAAQAAKKAPAAASKAGEDKIPADYKIPDPVEINAKQIIPVLVNDSQGIHEKKDGKKPAALVIDSEQGITGRLLQYNDKVNPIDGRSLVKNAKVKQEDCKKTLLTALVGCLRYGKVLMINISYDDDDDNKDPSEEQVFKEIKTLFDAVEPGLMNAVLKREVATDEQWFKTVISKDDSEASKNHFFGSEELNAFHLMVLMKGEATKELAFNFTLFKVE